MSLSNPTNQPMQADEGVAPNPSTTHVDVIRQSKVSTPRTLSSVSSACESEPNRGEDECDAPNIKDWPTRGRPVADPAKNSAVYAWILSQNKVRYRATKSHKLQEPLRGGFLSTSMPPKPRVEYSTVAEHPAFFEPQPGRDVDRSIFERFHQPHDASLSAPVSLLTSYINSSRKRTQDRIRNYNGRSASILLNTPAEKEYPKPDCQLSLGHGSVMPGILTYEKGSLQRSKYTCGDVGLLQTDELFDESMAGFNSHFFQELVWYIDHGTYLALRLTCSAWYQAITKYRPPSFPAVYRCPVEIVQHIYKFLQPIDFNAARHTCHAWMTASLHGPLLQSMLLQGGWWTDTRARINSLTDSGTGLPTLGRLKGILHSHLARECAFASGWTGNGVDELESISERASRHPNIDHGNYYRKRTEANITSPTFSIVEPGLSRNVKTPFVLISTVEFYELGELRPPAELSSSSTDIHPAYQCYVSLSASVCGRFALAVNAHRIYIYCLCSNGNIRLLRCVSCPRKVLAVSMDASCDRYAVAVLLHGRAGLLIPFAQKDTADIAHTLGASFASPIQNLAKVETRHRRMYWDLCTAEDPPLSVAISPQQTHVAFGCASGIEIHWIDQVTRHSTSRWVPLTTPSDHLYFLHCRDILSSTERVRLISSASIHPQKDQTLITVPEDAFYCRNDQNSEYLVSCWNSRARDSQDSYRAIPLTDGFHILFTDPQTKALCLGYDMSFGTTTERCRQVIFQGPVGLPSVYAAGSDLSNGVRIVAGYDDEIWFFSVPNDVFLCDDAGTDHPWTPTYWPSSNVLSAYSSKLVGDYAGHTQCRASILNANPSSNPTILSPTAGQLRTIWPLTLGGQYIGRLPRVMDVALDNHGPSITIWAFASSGIALAWQARRTGTEPPAHIIVSRCGSTKHDQEPPPSRPRIHEPVPNGAHQGCDSPYGKPQKQNRVLPSELHHTLNNESSPPSPHCHPDPVHSPLLFHDESSPGSREEGAKSETSGSRLGDQECLSRQRFDRLLPSSEGQQTASRIAIGAAVSSPALSKAADQPENPDSVPLVVTAGRRREYSSASTEPFPPFELDIDGDVIMCDAPSLLEPDGDAGGD